MSNHQPIRTHADRDTDNTGAAWLTPRPSWAQAPALQTELVDYAGSTFWIAYPLQPAMSTLAGRVQAATGRGPTIGDALRMARLA
jgi:hypothetical protein